MDNFSDTGQCKQNSVVDGQEDVTSVQASFLKDSPCADVVVHLDWRKERQLNEEESRGGILGLCVAGGVL